MADPTRLAIVCPCYNEQETLPHTAPQLADAIREMAGSGLIAPDSYILFVNDGSKDDTWKLIEGLHKENPTLFRGLDLAANVGHQNAIIAGMFHAAETAGIVVTMDVDLQDDLRVVPRMVRDYYEGADVVYGVRSDRSSDSFLKKFTAESFYKFQAKMGVRAIYNHADFRLMSRRVIHELERYGERNLYLRGIIPMIGFPSAIEEETRAERPAGQTKYTLRKMLTLALDGITSFSIRPVYWILGLGVLFVLVAMAIAVYVIVSLAIGRAVSGWPSLMLSIWLVGGCTLLSLGTIGLYVGRIFTEVKHRPRYHINQSL